MAPRPVWKGQLRLSLVSIPVELYSAQSRGARPAFRQIHAPSGKPVRYERTVPGIGPVEAGDIVKGYDTGEGDYMLIEPEEVEAIKLETKKTLELVQFVDSCEIPPIYFDRPYYLVPADDLAEESYRVLRDALRQSGKAGLGQVAMRGREYLTALRPCGDGLLLETLHYPDEIREAEPFFASVEDEKADEELLDLATTLIDRKTAAFDASAYEDRYAEALKDLIETKRKSGKTPRVERGESGGRREGENVVDLMGALKESLEKDKSRGTGSKSASSGRSPKRSGKRRKAS
ncbi:Ku protein [Rhodosalinus halophilus]|uniref:Non-homologous end joining protein Ku n=1 Tax=Rhodosalinus halophilus TaxID=2259333 RepID=A0A365UBE3_9RHOB|nr:Ku protein [Rhodosalinus halophilus]RBI86366.1 Ku protein [Rhodosalinus halophilus]